MGRHTVFALALMVVACDSPVEVETWVQLGQVAKVELAPVLDREISLAITTEGTGCLVAPGRTEVSTEGMAIDIMPFDTMRSAGVCTSMRVTVVHEVRVQVSDPGNYTAIIHGRDPVGDTTTTIREITVR